MSTAAVSFPRGQHASAGAKLKVDVKYTGPDPPPTDWHVYTRPTGSQDWAFYSGGDLSSDPRKGLHLELTAGNVVGAFDLRVDWTWKDPAREETGTDKGQYFVDPALQHPPPALDAPDEEGEAMWWRWLLLPVTGPVEIAVLILYAPFGLLKLGAIDSPFEGWLKDLARWIRDNVLPPPFSTWGR